VLNDPTRPPPGIYSNEAAGSAAVSEPVLQSVMISPTERSAIIGGKTVKLGGKYGDARIVKITEGEVVLRSASGTETLRMYPDVSMKPIEPTSSLGNKRARKNSEPAVNTRGKQR
jgi:MSHA biogenesis protein MshK